jgi:hypothetical protein
VVATRRYRKNSRSRLVERPETRSCERLLHCREAAMANYWIEQKCARLLLWWRSGEIAIELWANFREEFLDELSRHIGSWGSEISVNVDHAIRRINRRMASPDAAVDSYDAIDLTLAKYGFAKLPPIIPPPPGWPPHKWSAKDQRWEPEDANGTDQ